MSAFVVATPLIPCIHNSRQCRDHRTVAIADNSSPDVPSSVSLDTFSNFKSFCWRTQASLCDQTAAADGLGTFQRTPDSFPLPQTFHPCDTQTMTGGRAFESAVVNVWTSDSASNSRRTRQRVLTSLDKSTAHVDYIKEAVGLTIKLLPRNPALPRLRADMHYFQIGGGSLSWWFSGTADLCLGPIGAPNAFMSDLELFLKGWHSLCSRHRTGGSHHARRSFLEDCFERKENDIPVHDFDRVTSFAFVTEAVDALLPAYLPLVTSGHSRSFAKDIETGFGKESIGDCLQFGDGIGNEETDHFCIKGGASCESTTVRSSPLGSWRFSLAPSALSAAGKAYDSLRNDQGATGNPVMYL